VKALLAGNGGKYDVERDPLWNGQLEEEPEPFHQEEIAFYQCDHLGTPQELTDHEGKIAWAAEYKAWGQTKEIISDAARKAGLTNPIRFQGQYLDEETGLHFNRHRYYDPVAGRFISSDPIGLLGGLNLHQYAPNTTAWVDPLGLAGSTFPADPADMTAALGVQPKVGTTPDGTTRHTWSPNQDTRIRHESHPHGLCPNSPGYNPRHHGEHYHVETKPSGFSWNNAKNNGLIVKSQPPGYTPGSGTGFLPGEAFPGS